MPKFLAWREPSRYLSILKKGDFEKETLRKALVQAKVVRSGCLFEVTSARRFTMGPGLSWTSTS